MPANILALKHTFLKLILSLQFYFDYSAWYIFFISLLLTLYSQLFCTITFAEFPQADLKSWSSRMMICLEN